jgi:hypothetical protein
VYRFFYEPGAAGAEGGLPDRPEEQGMRTSERAFTILETLVSVAIIVTVTFGLVMLFRNLAQGTNADAAFRKHYDDETGLIARLQRDAASAIAVFIPAADVLGNANADGHEVDFLARDSQHRAVFWAYSFNAAAGTVTRYTYAAPGGSPTVSEPALTGFTAFAAQPIAASSLAADPLAGQALAGYAPTDVALNVGYPGISAGNGLVAVRAANAAVDRTVRLLAGTAPTGFTISGTYAPAPGATDAAGNTYAQESTCAKPPGFDYTDASTSPPTDYFNVPPANCPSPPPPAHQRFGGYDCSAAPGALLSTNYELSPPADIFNYEASLLAEYCNGQTLTPAAGDPHQLAVETNCAKGAGFDYTDATTLPPTDYLNVVATCANAPPTATTISDWQYRSTTPGCAWNASGGVSQTCTLTATLIRSNDSGLYWVPVDCTYDGSFDPTVGSYTYAADTAHQSGCPSTDVFSLPPLYGNTADPRV